jgi:hypothetical protein
MKNVVGPWYKTLEQQLLEFAKQYPKFAAINNGQYQIILAATQIGVTMETSANDKSKGAQIKEILNKLSTKDLPNNNLPYVDTEYLEESAKLITIYKEHLARYESQVHKQYPPAILWLPKKVIGEDLAQVNKDISQKDIPTLLERLSVVVKEFKTQSVTTTTTIQTTSTITSSSSVILFPKVSEPEEKKPLSKKTPREQAHCYVDSYDKDIKANVVYIEHLKKLKSLKSLPDLDQHILAAEKKLKQNEFLKQKAINLLLKAELDEITSVVICELKKNLNFGNSFQNEIETLLSPVLKGENIKLYLLDLFSLGNQRFQDGINHIVNAIIQTITATTDETGILHIDSLTPTSFETAICGAPEEDHGPGSQIRALG